MPRTVLTIRRSSTGKWYVTFSCEVESQRLPVSDKVVGIDVGLHTFAMLSDGTATRPGPGSLPCSLTKLQTLAGE